MSRVKAASERKGNARKAKDKTVVAGKFGGAVLEVPDMPDWLASDDRASDVWADVWADIKNISARSDRFLVARYVHMLLEFESIVVDLGGTRTTTGSTGSLIVHPDRKLLSELQANLLRYEDKIGLSPEARARLGIAQEDSRDEFEKWMDDA
mgnify:CR=1 FL=1